MGKLHVPHFRWLSLPWLSKSLPSILAPSTPTPAAPPPGTYQPRAELPAVPGPGVLLLRGSPSFSAAGSWDAGSSSLPPLQSRGMRRCLYCWVEVQPGGGGDSEGGGSCRWDPPPSSKSPVSGSCLQLGSPWSSLRKCHGSSCTSAWALTANWSSLLIPGWLFRFCREFAWCEYGNFASLPAPRLQLLLTYVCSPRGFVLQES